MAMLGMIPRVVVVESAAGAGVNVGVRVEVEPVLFERLD